MTVPEADAGAALDDAQRRPGCRLRRAERAPACRRDDRATVSTSDPYAYLQWSLENPNDADIDVSGAWSVGERPGDGVNVAVVDQMIHATHKDLAAERSP